MNDISLQVFRLDNDGTFDCIGEITQFTALQWRTKYNGYAEFELWAPATSRNKELLKEGLILWAGDSSAAKIEIIDFSMDEEGQKTYNIKGRTLECLLSTRIIWGTYTCSNKYASTAMYEIVRQQCIISSENRIIPFLECAEDEFVGERITYQKTGNEVYESLVGIADDNGLGFDITFDPRNKKLIFKVTKGKDRTNAQSVNNFVIFSTELNDILQSSYYKNVQDKKNVALVAGEGSGAERKKAISGDNDLAGLMRQEVYIDARDLQSEVDEGTTISDDEYYKMLTNRGNEKLSELKETETFSAIVRTINNAQYSYKKDYNKGDKVIVKDTELGVITEAVIDEVEESYSDSYELNLTLGYGYPTLLQQIKRKIF